jgi:hypothetical protein
MSAHANKTDASRASKTVASFALAMAMLAAPRVDARPDVQGGAQLHYELSALHDIEDDGTSAPAARDFVLAGARLHGFIGNRWLGYHMGIDLAAGGTIRGGGFAYDVALFPAGVALRFAETSFLTLGIGVGASGATGTLDDAATFPVEARFELGRGIRVLGRARAVFLAGADGRQDGARFADELEAMLALRIGRAYSDWGFPTGNGYFVGATYREALGATFAGVVIGYSIDMGSPRTSRGPRDYPGCPECE